MDGEGEGYGVDLLTSSFEVVAAAADSIITPGIGRIVPESDFRDDLEMEKRASRHPLKCNLTKQPPPATKGLFSYNRFAHYLQMKSEVERCERLVKVLSSQEEDRSVFGLEYYSDVILKEELINLYGAMDEGSSRFQKLFQNYKEERYEQLEKWIAEENDLKKKMREEVDSGFYGQIEVPNLQDWFTVDEIIAFDKVSIPHLVKTDHFVLPRPVKGEQDILEDYIRINGGTPNGGQQLKLSNLCGFDPDLNVKEVVIPEISNTTVGDMLQSKMLAIIEENPAGISNEAFLTEFKNRNQYYPQPKSMNYPSFPVMMKALGEHVIHIQNMEDVATFYFPMCLQGLVNSPRVILWNIWHKLRIVVRLYHGIVRISTCFRFCEKLFGWKRINWQAWGCTSQFDLVQCLIREFGECGVRVMAECEIKPTGRNSLWFLIEVNNDQVDQYIEQYSLRVPEKELPSSSSLRREFNADKMVRSSTKKYESQSSPTPIINQPSSERTWEKIEPNKLNMNQTSSEAFPSLVNSQQLSQSKKKGRKWKPLPSSSLANSTSISPHPSNTETTWSSLLKK